MDLGDSPRSDFLGFELLLEDEDRARLHRVREHMETHIEPVINDYWTRAEFPQWTLGGARRRAPWSQPVAQRQPNSSSARRSGSVAS